MLTNITALLRSDRMAEAVYLLLTLSTLKLIQRAKDTSIKRENAVMMMTSLLPSELPHKMISIHVAAVLFLIKYKPNVFRGWLGAGTAVAQLFAFQKLSSMFKENMAAVPCIQDGMARANYSDEIVKSIGTMDWKRWLMVVLPVPQPIVLSLSFPGVLSKQTYTYAYVGPFKTNELQMDVYKHKNTPSNAPMLLYIHGGAWTLGDRRFPPFPLVYQAASLGWIVCSIDYRLSPKAKFPEHLIDCKRALAFLRTQGKSQLDGDENFIAVAGESAGGHLASLVALTSEDKSFQPGFEDVDTSVRGCVDVYGVHDFLDRHSHYYCRDNSPGFLRYLELLVMQRPQTDRDAYDEASPLSWVEEERASIRKRPIPPFLVAHGTHDTMVPFDDSKSFYETLQEYRLEHGSTVDMSDVFLELPGAYHMFNFTVSPRALAFGDAVGAFLSCLYRQDESSVADNVPSRL